VAGIVLLVCASVATAATQAPATRTAGATRRPRPNLIVVVADGLRVDRLQSRYMRFLHGIGSNGVVFSRAYAPAPSRTPSVASLLAFLALITLVLKTIVEYRTRRSIEQ
jgi:membrane-anchored protein YejM (alkaline phosphatase superfamily)